MVTKGEADLLVYSRNYTCKWDSCAGEAIIKGMGGYYVDFKNRPLIYDDKQKNYLNGEGQICTLSKDIL